LLNYLSNGCIISNNNEKIKKRYQLLLHWLHNPIELGMRGKLKSDRPTRIQIQVNRRNPSWLCLSLDSGDTRIYMSVGLGSIKSIHEIRTSTRIYVKLHNYPYVYISVKLRFFTHSFTHDTTSFSFEDLNFNLISWKSILQCLCLNFLERP
jgi:hypothetical protein